MKKNILLCTDVYKMGHMEQYVPNCNLVYSHLIARSGKTFDKTVFFGLQYYLKEYLSQPITEEMGEEFLKYREMILGSNSESVTKQIRALCKLGYLPIEIKAVNEGDVIPVKNVLMTIVNTMPDHPEFYWVVGFIESLILKIWYSCTVASCSYKYRKLVDRFFEETVSEDMMFLKDFMVHDFGYRGDGSEEGACISGVAHLTSFLGSDTVPALSFAIDYYNADTSNPIMLSVPASEHSVMCSFGRENELGAFKNMFRLYPTGIVSIVSDQFDVYRVLTEFAEELKSTILERDGKTVFRPDSGDPETIICGDMNAPEGSNEWFGAIRLLDNKFGSTVNSKGYKVLNPKVGLIYGDGMYYERYEKILQRLKDMGYASSNLIIGVGGILRNHSRDTMGYAIKCTHVEVNGVPQDIEKDPVTDSGKKSFKGLLQLSYDDMGEYVTIDECMPHQEALSLLTPVFRDGKILRETTLTEIRERVKLALQNV